MTITIIRYHGQIAAVAARTRFYLHPGLDVPARTHVALMCRFAADVEAGLLPGPYTHERADCYARACLAEPP